MKYIGIFFSIVILGAVALALLRPQVAGAADSGTYISHGDAVTLGNHLPSEPGDYVLFQYTADWCGPCRMIEPSVVDLVKRNEFVTRKKIDIVSWDSPAFMQMNEFFGASYIPFFALYNEQGEPIATGDYRQIQNAIARIAAGR